MSNDAAKRRKTYKAALYDAQVQLVKVQKHVIDTERQVLLIFEGRDAAGKDGTIKRIVEHLSPRQHWKRFEFDGKDRAVALANPDVVFPYDQASLTNGMIAP